MNQKKGEIATLLTLGLMLFGTVVTIASSFFVSNEKTKLKSNSKATSKNCVYTSLKDCNSAIRMGECNSNNLTTTCTSYMCKDGKTWRCPGTTDDSNTSTPTTSVQSGKGCGSGNNYECKPTSGYNSELCPNPNLEFACCVQDNFPCSSGATGTRYRWYGCTGQPCYNTKIKQSNGPGYLVVCPNGVGPSNPEMCLSSTATPTLILTPGARGVSPSPPPTATPALGEEGGFCNGLKRAEDNKWYDGTCNNENLKCNLETGKCEKKFGFSAQTTTFFTDDESKKNSLISPTTPAPGEEGGECLELKEKLDGRGYTGRCNNNSLICNSMTGTCIQKSGQQQPDGNGANNNDNNGGTAGESSLSNSTNPSESTISAFGQSILTPIDTSNTENIINTKGRIVGKINFSYGEYQSIVNQNNFNNFFEVKLVKENSGTLGLGKTKWNIKPDKAGNFSFEDVERFYGDKFRAHPNTFSLFINLSLPNGVTKEVFSKKNFQFRFDQVEINDINALFDFYDYFAKVTLNFNYMDNIQKPVLLTINRPFFDENANWNTENEIVLFNDQNKFSKKTMIYFLGYFIGADSSVKYEIIWGCKRDNEIVPVYSTDSGLVIWLVGGKSYTVKTDISCN